MHHQKFEYLGKTYNKRYTVRYRSSRNEAESAPHSQASVFQLFQFDVSHLFFRFALGESKYVPLVHVRLDWAIEHNVSYPFSILMSHFIELKYGNESKDLRKCNEP